MLSRTLCLLAATVMSCADVECSINSDCGDRARCVENRCVRDCRQDRDCPKGMSCSLNGECRAGAPSDAAVDVAPDAPDDLASDMPVAVRDVEVSRDDGVPDIAQPDVAPDVPAMDVTPDVTPPDVAQPDIVTMDAAPDVTAPDAAVDTAPVDLPRPDASGPVAAGVYEFVGVRPDTLVAPVAVAWHPSGAYALVLSASDAVYRYDAAMRTVARVAMVGSTVSWRTLAFTPDGARAMLLGNTGMLSAPTGRMWIWDHAASTLTERTDGRLSAYYEALRWAPDRSRAAVLTRTSSVTTVRFVDATGAATGTPAARGMVANTGCNDLAWVRDGFGDPAIAVACGYNTGEIVHVENLAGTARFTVLASSGAVGNVNRIAARPQADLALAIGGTSRVYRYRAARWDTGFSSPTAVSSFGVSFNDDGTRAFAFGGFGVLTEYRYDLYAMSDFTEARIPLADAPYAQPTEARVNDVAWRPGCDEGLAVGGANTFSRTSAFVAYFRALNGRRCP